MKRKNLGLFWSLLIIGIFFLPLNIKNTNFPVEKKEQTNTIFQENGEFVTNALDQRNILKNNLQFSQYIQNPEPQGDDENDEDEDDLDDEFESLNQRELSIQYSSNEASIQSHLENELTNDEIDYQIQLTEDGIQFQIHYHSESDSSTTEIQFEVLFEKLIEYDDTNGDGLYDTETDSFIKEYLIDTYKTIEYEKIISPSNENIHYFKLTTSEDIFTIHAYFSEGFTTINNTLITPVEMKFAIEINDFPYFSSNSALALQVQINSEYDMEEEEETEYEQEGYRENEQGLNLTAETTSGFFTWEKFALYDGVLGQVNHTSLTGDSESGEFKFFLIYSNATNIFHDPSIGIAGILLEPNENPAPIEEPDSIFQWWFYPIIILAVLFALMMSKTEYRQYLLNRFLPINTEPHHLTMEEVLENEIRSNILNIIIDEPGIHYKELLRRSNVSPSSLAWHLDILETYKIIRKQRVGHYLIFYPYIDNNPFKNFDINLAKSKLTLDIFQMIGDNPGIQQNNIVKRLEINRKTLKYHIDKLEETGLIRTEKDGRRMLYYPMKIIEIEEDGDISILSDIDNNGEIIEEE